MKKNHLYIITFIAIALISRIIYVSATNSDTPATVQASSIAPVADHRFIPGLMPVDVYLNFENLGFSTEKALGGEHGNLWTNRYQLGDTEYIVQTWSPEGADNVSTVRISAIGDISDKAPFYISYLATLPYEGSDPTKAKQWVLDNFNNGGTTVIGPVRFELKAMSKRGRMLLMELNPSAPSR